MMDQPRKPRKLSGRRYPQGPARALLRIAKADPDVVAAVLIRNKIRWGRIDPEDVTWR
jgi:hypothetical protein